MLSVPERDMKMKWLIEDMQESDLPEVLNLERSVFGGMAWSVRDFESAIASKYDAPMVIHDGNQLAAYCVLRLLGPEAEILNICVSSPYRRKGYGDALMDQMLDIAAGQGVGKIWLEVRECNEPAKALYRKKGFTDAYVRKAYYSDPIEDAIIMLLER